MNTTLLHFDKKNVSFDQDELKPFKNDKMPIVSA